MHLDLAKLQVPPVAGVSGMHRTRGTVLFLFIPFLVSLLRQSRAARQSTPKLMAPGLLWAELRHSCVGIRHLVFDNEPVAMRAPIKAVLIIGSKAAV
jgi:succinate dehydrogenase/fumarate reductase cytochrome b subunit